MTLPELLVFDLDGTLIDSSMDLCLSVNAMLGAFGRTELPFASITSYIGNGAATLVQRALDASPNYAAGRGQQPTFDEAYDFFIRYYREHKLDNTRLYDGVSEALQTIREQAPETLMAVLTNKPVRPSREICDGLGIAGFFFQNYGGDSLPTKKPSPEGLLALIAEADALRRRRQPHSPALAPEQVVMIGDSGVDTATARNCGVRSLGCLFGLAPESLTASSPDLMVGHASQWPAVLGFVQSQLPKS